MHVPRQRCIDRCIGERPCRHSIPLLVQGERCRPVWLGRESPRAWDLSPLFGFNRELRSVPRVPATLQRIDVGKTLVDQLLCRPGTGKLIRSGTVEDQRGVFRIRGSETFDLGGIDASGPLDFLLTGLPVLAETYVDNDYSRAIELGTEFFLGHGGDRALGHRCLEQQAHERETHQDGERCTYLRSRHTVSPSCYTWFSGEVASSPVDAAARHRCPHRRQPRQARLRPLA